jgi:hypothetical protein
MVRRRRYLKRTDLFLVRVWTEDTTVLVDAKDSGHVSSGSRSKNSEEATHEEWSGSVQRVVDGEVRQFKGWQDLLDTLLAMVSGTGANLDQ